MTEMTSCLVLGTNSEGLEIFLFLVTLIGDVLTVQGVVHPELTMNSFVCQCPLRVNGPSGISMSKPEDADYRTQAGQRFW